MFKKWFLMVCGCLVFLCGTAKIALSVFAPRSFAEEPAAHLAMIITGVVFVVWGVSIIWRVGNNRFFPNSGWTENPRS